MTKRIAASLLAVGLLASCSTLPSREPDASGSESVTIIIVGAVKLPGRYTIPSAKDRNLHSLIERAGGLYFASPGSRGEVHVRHSGPDPAWQIFRLDPYRLMADGTDSSLNMRLSPGDVVRIREAYD